MNAAFDAASHELEIHLRDLRRLVSDFPVLPDGLDVELAELTTLAAGLDARVARLRGTLLALGAPMESPAPGSIVTAPVAGSGSREAAERGDRPVAKSPAERLAHLRELELTAAELGLPFDGAEEIAVLSAACGAPAASEVDTDPGMGPAGRG